MLVSDFSDSVPTLPPDNLQNFMVDPRREVPNDAQPANNRVQDLSDRNAIAVLLESDRNAIMVLAMTSLIMMSRLMMDRFLLVRYYFLPNWYLHCFVRLDIFQF